MQQDIINLYIEKLPFLNKCITDIHSIVNECGEPLEGNCFYIHNTLTLYEELYYKQVNLFSCGLTNPAKICEIGFNAGHSALLFLLGIDLNKPLDFTIFDIGEHKYVDPCFQYIKSSFIGPNYELIKGDSTIEMPRWIEEHPDLSNSYDVVHVDGGHSEHCIRNDMINAAKLVKKGGIIIIDDTQDYTINAVVDKYLASGFYKEHAIHNTNGYKHRMIIKL